MVTKVDSPKGIAAEGKHYYSIWQNIFEIDTKYVPIKPIGKGAYGIVCSAQNKETNEIAIMKIINVLENRTDAQRTLREIGLLQQIRHDNIIAVEDIMKPSEMFNINDAYLVFELMDMDLHQIIRSSQPLTDDHCQYFIYQEEEKLTNTVRFDLLFVTISHHLAP